MQDKIIITDIGSTTTKALLLKKIGDSYKFIDYTTAYTTVEKPYEDVKIGILNVIKKLESVTATELLASKESLRLKDDISYLSTSSAGGGLQIFVIGLTRADSVKSAKRVAYGVGGVLLDALSIEDGKTSSEKLQILNKAHPDIILFCGGVDDGALYNIYRLAEILKTANIKQKFTDNQNIPLVFAGNKQAVDFIKLVFRDKYNLHIVPNLRPSMNLENLEPAKNKVHDLFLENVMEQAPGYSEVKKLVNADILPTPSGVLNALKILSKKYDNIIAFDMGGATTDVYTFIHGQHCRSVSANFGMSYSIGNILALSDFEEDFGKYIRYITNSTTSPPHSARYLSGLTMTLNDFIEYIQNYIGNKILYPDFNPTKDIEKFIEHIIAISGIKMSLQQHFENNYKLRPNKPIEIISNFLLNKQVDEIYTLPFDMRKSFRKNDFEMIIGAGGVISHASKSQAIFILIESFQPSGLVELWRDKHFILPHIGVLSTVDDTIAESLLYNDCLEKLALYFRPKDFRKNNVLKIKTSNQELTIKSDEFLVYTSDTVENIYICGKSFNKMEIVLEENITLVIDTRLTKDCPINIVLDSLKLYDFSNQDLFMESSYSNLTESERINAFPTEAERINAFPTVAERINAFPTDHLLKYLLPFKGTINVTQGENVVPETLLWENRFDPPRMYVVLISSLLKRNLTKEELLEGIQISEKEIVEIGTPLFKSDKKRYFVTLVPGGLGMAPAIAFTPDKELTDDEINNGEVQRLQERISKGENIYIRKVDDIAYSPVKAIVERIDYMTGTVFLYEIQDYITEPVEINIAKALNVKPEEIKGFMKKSKGDFVYAGEFLAEKTSRPDQLITSSLQFQGKLLMEYLSTMYKNVLSPYTGNIIDVNTTTGIVTICYDKKPYQIFSMCYGKVESIIDENEINIRVNAKLIEGKIGFGANVGGNLSIFIRDSIKSGDIVYSQGFLDYDKLINFQEIGIKGLICNTISYSCLKKFLKKDIGVALTGNEILPFSIMILKGFTICPPHEACEWGGEGGDTNQEISNHSGKYALLQPQTQIRAGAIRPKLYIFNEE